MSANPEDRSDEPGGWPAYIEATRKLPPRPLLVRAASLVRAFGNTLDLGSGAGIDTRYLLSLGFRVTAVDADPAAIASLAGIVDERLSIVQCTFDDFGFERNRYDLINAQLSLPFSPPSTFDAMFNRLLTSLAPGGILTGHLFGVNDAWNRPESGMTFHTAAEVHQLLADLESIELREVEVEVDLVNGERVHAHMFGIIARRPAAKRAMADR
jgi:SAM-dependent methyltransferase